MTEEEKAAQDAAAAAARADADAKALADQDPLKTELDKVQGQKRTKLEKLQYRKKLIDEQLKDMGVDDEPVVEDDEQPLTRGEFKKMQAQEAQKTALQIADEIPNQTERELVKYHLENTIRSTGNPQQDLSLARSIVNDAKNRQILEEQQRKGQASSQSSGSGAPVRNEAPTELTVEELGMMKPPFNLTKEQVIAARTGGNAKFDKK